jgi:hypothetical protein
MLCRSAIDARSASLGAARRPLCCIAVVFKNRDLAEFCGFSVVLG